jgi:hypothetical protein
MWEHQERCRCPLVNMKRFALIPAVLCLFIATASYAYISGRFDVLRRTGHYTIEVNGAAVYGDVLVGRASAVVTRRDNGNAHSYLLLYAGDVDRTSDIGQVIDCGEWIAPRLPILIRTSNYPRCNVRSATAGVSRTSLTLRGRVQQFTTGEQNVISIER